MYSEKIDTIMEGLSAYNNDLRSTITSIIKDIMKYAKDKDAHNINVFYYTESEIDNYNFCGIDGNGYGSALSISDIDCYRKDNPIFNMVNEDGNDFENRNLDDFDTTELTYIARMLNDLLNVVIEDGDVKTIEYDDYAI